MKISSNEQSLNDIILEKDIHRIVKSVLTDKAEQKTTSSKNTNDSVNMSDLTRLLSESSSGLSKTHKARPEKIAEAKDITSNNIEISDRAIDVIFSRITQA